MRSHDDIGWTFADEDAAELGIDGYRHRRFLNDFYVGRFPGTFARGVPFQENPKTGDARVAGTTASLAGVEAGDAGGVDRVLLAHAIALSTGGIPLLYLGDEVAQLNDYSYADDPAKAGDSRWVHRPARPVERYAQRHGCRDRRRARLRRADRPDPRAAGDARVRRRRARRLRRAGIRPCSAISGRAAVHVILVLANVGDDDAYLDPIVFSGFTPGARDIVHEREVRPDHGFVLPPHGFAWLRVVPL